MTFGTLKSSMGLFSVVSLPFASADFRRASRLNACLLDPTCSSSSSPSRSCSSPLGELTLSYTRDSRDKSLIFLLPSCHSEFQESNAVHKAGGALGIVTGTRSSLLRLSTQSIDSSAFFIRLLTQPSAPSTPVSRVSSLPRPPTSRCPPVISPSPARRTKVVPDLSSVHCVHALNSFASLAPCTFTDPLPVFH
jgi:hypothetical protein